MWCRIAVTVLVVGLSASSISAQVLAGAEFRVNSYTTGDQGQPAVASDAAGNFVVAWTSDGQDGYSYGVFAQRFDASGGQRGPEFQVNAYTTSWQWEPAVASDATGGFVVVWVSSEQDESDWGIFARRYDASGAARGGEFRVNTYTTGTQLAPSVASDASGNFVIVWNSIGQDGDKHGVFGQRYDASGTPRGPEFQINTYTTSYQEMPSVALDASGNVIAVWTSFGPAANDVNLFGQRFDAAGNRVGGEFQVNTYTTSSQIGPKAAFLAEGRSVIVWWGSTGEDGDGYGVFGQRFDAAGNRVGGEFRVNSYTTGMQAGPTVAADGSGAFLVSWLSDLQDGDGYGVFGQRFDAGGAPRGPEFRVNTYTTSDQFIPVVASDAVGNLVATFASYLQDGSTTGVFGQRFGGLHPELLSVDPVASGGSNGNGVLEPGETVTIAPSWRNLNGAPQLFGGDASSFAGPPASGVFYLLQDATAGYGTVPDGALGPCTDCYEVQLAFAGTRPAQHWDGSLVERITPDAFGETKNWPIHVGESFTDVPTTSPYYRFVETLLHKHVTGGCSADSYCPANAVTREQMSVFVLVGKEGSGYSPTACGTPVFGDVPASSPFCRWIEELARRGVVSGCGGGNYCPTNPVTREQMSVFLLHVLDPALSPPACGTPVFGDVPAASPFCRWIEELARRGITGGCGGGNYCPTDPVTREQMAVFISASFGLSLYGP